MKKHSIICIGIKKYNLKLRIASRTNSISSCLKLLKEFGPFQKFDKWHVTRKGVAEQGFYGCVFCVNARFTDQGSRVNPAVTFINESGGFYHFWKEVSAGCAWSAWEVLLFGCVGWEVQEEGGANDGGGWCRIDELLRR